MEVAEQVSLNNHPEVVPVPSYDFSAPTDSIPRVIQNGERKFILTAILKRRTLNDLIEREKGLTIDREASTGGTEVERIDVDSPNANLFDKIIVGGTVQEYGVKDAPIKERTQEQMLALTKEHKSAFIGRLYRLTSEVLEVKSNDDDELAFASESAPGEIAVRQLHGDPLLPDHIIEYQFKRPSQAQRDRFMAATQSKLKRRGNKPIRSFVTDFRKCYEVALELFRDMSGATGSPQEIDPVFLVEACTAVMVWFKRDAEDF